MPLQSQRHSVRGRGFPHVKSLDPFDPGDGGGACRLARCPCSDHGPAGNGGTGRGPDTGPVRSLVTGPRKPPELWVSIASVKLRNPPLASASRSMIVKTVPGFGSTSGSNAQCVSVHPPALLHPEGSGVALQREPQLWGFECRAHRVAHLPSRSRRSGLHPGRLEPERSLNPRGAGSVSRYREGGTCGWGIVPML